MERRIDEYAQEYYTIGSQEFSESEILDIYNEYCVNNGFFNEVINFNDDDFFNAFNTRRELLEETCNNKEYDVNDEYVTYERGLYLKSGSLMECIDGDYMEEIEKQLNGDDDDE